MHAAATELMTSGAQAQVYTGHFIAVHLREMSGGKTYAQLLGQPKNTALAGLVQTVFRGTTLRGLLRNAYAFWKMGEIMLIAGIVALAAAGLMLILSLLGSCTCAALSPSRRCSPRSPPGSGHGVLTAGPGTAVPP